MDIVGEEEEAIVYLYCSCDRDTFWPQIGVADSPMFIDRFNNQLFYLTEGELRDSRELTVANELEIAENNPYFIDKYGHSLSELFVRMEPYISDCASDSAKELLATCK